MLRDQEGSHGVVAVVLAAGLSERFGSSKLTAPFRGRPLVKHVIGVACRAIGEGLVDRVVAVVPADDGALQQLVREAGATAVINPDPTRGLASSIRIGLDAVAGAQAAVILLGDQPLVSLEAVAALLDAHRASPGAVVRPAYGAEAAPGHPVIVPCRWWPRLSGGEGDRGFAAALGPEVPVIRLPLPGRNPDVDTPSDLAELDADPKGAT